MDRYTAGVGG